MAKFCTKCGRPLTEGEVCSCSANFTTPPAPPTPKVAPKSAQGNTGIKKVWENIKNSAGIGDTESNKTDAFEKGKRIIPDCVRPNDSEIPVKQYEIATLRNRFAFITYAKAVGRIQVTNKRVIFRAPGRSIVGRTTLQHEFSIDEIAGFETRREYLFNFWDLLVALITLTIGVGIGGGIQALAMEDLNVALALIAGFILGPIGSILFFKIKKRWSFKLIGLGVSASAGLMGAFIAFDEGGFAAFVGVFVGLFGIVATILALITIFLNSFRPNLALLIKTKAATHAIDIVRKKRAIPFLGQGTSETENHTGYYEILPLENTEKSIRELGALINDIQKLGDFGIEKWKVQ